MEKNENTPFIFFLVFDENLPRVFFTFHRTLKSCGLMLVPVRIDQLQKIISASEQNQVIVISSVINSVEMKNYNEKVRELLKFILKNKRLTFMLLSSFSKLSDFNLFSFSKNYFFLKYPLDAVLLSEKISRYYQLKSKTNMKWPGGRRPRMAEAL
jgi:hypothetical protein